MVEQKGNVPERVAQIERDLLELTMLFEFQIAGESRDADVCILGTLLQNGNQSSITHQG